MIKIDLKENVMPTKDKNDNQSKNKGAFIIFISSLVYSLFL